MWKSPDGCSENKNSSRAFCAMRPSPTHRQQSSLLYVKGGPCWPPLFFQFTPFPLCGNGSQGIPQLDQDRPHESQIVIVQLASHRHRQCVDSGGKGQRVTVTVSNDIPPDSLCVRGAVCSLFLFQALWVEGKHRQLLAAVPQRQQNFLFVPVALP